jgi:hypothetical protein
VVLRAARARNPERTRAGQQLHLREVTQPQGDYFDGLAANPWPANQFTVPLAHPSNRTATAPRPGLHRQPANHRSPRHKLTTALVLRAARARNPKRARAEQQLHLREVTQPRGDYFEGLAANPWPANHFTVQIAHPSNRDRNSPQTWQNFTLQHTRTAQAARAQPSASAVH